MGTFQELLQTLKAADDVVDEEINWEEMLTSVTDKVDEIKYIVDRLDFEVKLLDEQVKAFNKRKQSVAKNLENLKKYVNWSMYSAEFEKIPGKKWEIRRQKNPPAINVSQEATMEYWQKYEQFVRRKVEYSWKKDDIKKELESPNFPDELRQIVSKVQDTSIRFSLKRSQQDE